ncbi:MAG: class I tRNA ligase family protein, partial [Oscillospiraceae bacterium]|nr:class I tRNA ligase family protein [Oscillospiraceae bacterium]
LGGEDAAAKAGAERVLLFVLIETLKLLHPFMPFITEEIWQALPHEGEALMIEDYPAYRAELDFPAEEAQFEKIMEAVRAIRVRRSEMKVPPSKKSKALIITEDAATFEAGRVYFGKLAYVSELTITGDAPDSTAGQVSVVTQDAQIFLPLADLVDLEAERTRIQGEIAKAEAQLAGQMKKLANEAFVQKAKPEVVANEQEKADRARALIRNLEESLKQLDQ